MASPARTKFATRYAEYSLLLSLCCKETAHWRTQKKYAARDQALLRAALVMLCSHVEGFLEDLASDVVNSYDDSSVSVAGLPEALRIHQVIGDGQPWNYTDKLARWKAVKTWLAHPLVIDDGSKPSRCMDPVLHTKGFANPGSNEITALFKTLGFEDIWLDCMAIEPNKIYRNTLDAMVARRNQIAHGKADATVTLGDARTYGARMDRLVTVIDDAAERRLNMQMNVTNCWDQIR